MGDTDSSDESSPMQETSLARPKAIFQHLQSEAFIIDALEEEEAKALAPQVSLLTLKRLENLQTQLSNLGVFEEEVTKVTLPVEFSAILQAFLG